MAHSAEDIYLLVMTGGYRAADIERWAEEIAAEAVDDERESILEEGYERGFEKGKEEGLVEGFKEGYDEAIDEAKKALRYLER